MEKKLKLFVWISHTTVISLAPDVETARKLVREKSEETGDWVDDNLLAEEPEIYEEQMARINVE